ncbi:MAG: FAD-dependent oxidoreductase [bacterium]
MGNKYDLVIIGAGAAGLTAALYAVRRKLSTLVVSKDLGGQTAATLDIENYPGVESSTGPDLMQKFASQAKKFGAEIQLDSIKDIQPTADGFNVQAESGKNYYARAVILAFGKSPRLLDVPGEAQFRNRGVVYCATCDAPLFKGKIVAVVGGGNAALDAMLLLEKIAGKVYLIHRRDSFRAEEVLIERAKQSDKIEFVLNAAIKEIKGDQFVTDVIVETPAGERKLGVEGVFVEIGQEVPSGFVKKLVEVNGAGEIVIDELNQTSRLGVFAAGDATTVAFKQTIISAGEGAKAALSVYNYLQGPTSGPASYAK